MKRLSLILTVVAIGIVVIAFSQTKSHDNARKKVKQYIDTYVFPLIEKQQIMYLKKLSDSEMEKLKDIKEGITERRIEPAVNRNQNQKKAGIERNYRYPMTSEMFTNIKKITDAHPKLNESYKEFVEKNKKKWIADINEIHEKNDVQPMRNKSGSAGIDVFFTRASNPDWLLLWDPSNPRLFNNMHIKTNNDIKSKSGEYEERKRNPQLRAEIRSLATKNIIPVIAKERKAFDSELTDDERKIIETARQKIEVRKVMFKNWYESEDFVAGQRAKDPNFDGMRKDMQNSMAEVREIAIAHSAEIRESTSRVRNHADEWEKEISTIAKANNQNPEHVLRMVRQQIRKSNTPVAFLLFNPDKADETELFDINPDDNTN